MLRANSIAARLREGAAINEELSGPNAPGSADPLVITPSPNLAEMEASGSASVDLRLGTWFVSLRQTRMSHLEVDDPEIHTQFTKTHFVPFGESYFLHPRSFVLGTTLEWVRLPRDLAAYVVGRSSWGRRGLIIATATGVHPGFKGCITLELTNVGEIPTAIRPGMAICQLFFHDVTGPEPKGVDRSQFAASRKPTVGRISPDSFFQNLTNSPQTAWAIAQYKSLVIRELNYGRSVDEMKEEPTKFIDQNYASYLSRMAIRDQLSVVSQLRTAHDEAVKASKPEIHGVDNDG